MQKVVALYKAFSGGEWFGASLLSVAGKVDGIVVMMSTRSWNGMGANDCTELLAAWIKEHPKCVVTVVTGAWTKQEDQYREGLEVIAKQYGEDTRVLIVDTDEVWDACNLAQLIDEIKANPGVTFFRGYLHTYLKEVLYRVWPSEASPVTVALGSCKVPEIIGRFHPPRGTSASGVHQSNVRYHHMAYVRESDDKIRQKFMTTSHQETVPSNTAWLKNVWERLPFGYNLHMTPGCEQLWQQAHGLLQHMVVPELMCGLTKKSIDRANMRWRAWIEQEKPSSTVVPQPSPEQVKMYGHWLKVYTDKVGDWVASMKTTVLESLFLARAAQGRTSILEIGSGSGGSMIALALGSAGCQLTSVDPFTPYDEENSSGMAVGVTEGNEELFDSNAKFFGYDHRVRKIKKTSDRAVEDIKGETFDLIFVDGNHTYEIVKSDLELYWPLVKPGGLLVGHDYTTRFPGVIRAVREWEHSAKVTVPHGTTLFYLEKGK